MILNAGVCSRALLVLLAWGMVAQGEGAVYKWVQPDGTVVYTDRPPTEDASPATLPPVQAIPGTPSPTSPSPGTHATAQAVPYTDFHITNPTQGETLRDNAGNIDVEFTVTPALQTDQGHRFVVMLDGKPITESLSEQIALPNVDRGSHSVSGLIADGEGQTLASTETVTFYLQRYSALNPGKAAP